MVVREGVAFLVFEEDAGNAANGEGVMVAVGGQFAAVERLEEPLLRIDLLEQSIARQK